MKNVDLGYQTDVNVDHKTYFKVLIGYWVREVLY